MPMRFIRTDLPRADTFALRFDYLVDFYISAAGLTAELNSAPTHAAVKTTKGEPQRGPEYGADDL